MWWKGRICNTCLNHRLNQLLNHHTFARQPGWPYSKTGIYSKFRFWVKFVRAASRRGRRHRGSVYRIAPVTLQLAILTLPSLRRSQRPGPFRTPG